MWHTLLPGKLRNIERTDDPVSRGMAGQFGGWVSIVVNLVLFIIKLILGFLSGSIALIADAFHTLSDIATSVILLFSFKITQKPGDSIHPFGHGRADYIATIMVATILAVTGFEIGKSSFLRIMHPAPLHPPLWIILIVLMTILVKEGLARFSIYLGNLLNSHLLEADAWHHRSDALSSILVMVAMTFSYFGIPYLDGWVGLLIAVFIIYTAYRVSKKSVDSLLGTFSDEQFIHRVEEVALNFSEILGVHDIIVHSYGPVKIISYHIEVDEDLSLVRAHQVSEEVDQQIRKELGVHTTVHVDPVMKRTPQYKHVERTIRKFCRNNPEILSFHDLRILKEQSKIRVFVDLVTQLESTIRNEEQLRQEVKRQIESVLPEVNEVQVKVEPKFSISRRSRHD